MNEMGEHAVADALGEVRTELARMGTTLTLLVQRIDPVITDHEQRMRATEKALAEQHAALETFKAEQRTTLRVWLSLVGSTAAAGGGGLGVLLSHLTGS